MSIDILKTVPGRRGHFVLESGYHTDLWLSLDGLFVSPHDLAPQIATLAEKLRTYDITAVCGPLLGGAFLAQALATRLGVRFYFAQPAPAPADSGLFKAIYRLPPELRRRVVGERIALVDEVISAGSSVRATAAELDAAGAEILVVGTLLCLGRQAIDHFAALNIPLLTLAQQDFHLWPPAECPLCRSGAALENPLTSL